MIDLEQIFDGMSTEIVTEEHMIRFVDGVIVEARDAMTENSLDDLPVTSVIVSMCRSCEKLHAVASQMTDIIEGESLLALPPDGVFFHYCKRMGESVIGMGQIPMVVAFIVPVNYVAKKVPDEVDMDDMQEVIEYAESVIDIHGPGSGEASIIHAASVNGIRRIGIEFAERDVNGFIKPVPGPDEMDERNFSPDDEAVMAPTTDAVWAGIDKMFNSAKMAAVKRMMGGEIDLGDVSFHDGDHGLF